jgi:hypothetical protein
VREQIHDATTRRWTPKTAEDRVSRLNGILRGWGAYFSQGLVFEEYREVQGYAERRLRRWLMKKHQRPGKGYRRYPHEHLYERLGLYRLHAPLYDPSRAKA